MRGARGAGAQAQLSGQGGAPPGLPALALGGLRQDTRFHAHAHLPSVLYAAASLLLVHAQHFHLYAKGALCGPRAVLVTLRIDRAIQAGTFTVDPMQSNST